LCTLRSSMHLNTKHKNTSGTTFIHNSLWFLNRCLQNIRGRFSEEQSRCNTVTLSYLLNDDGSYLYTKFQAITSRCPGQRSNFTISGIYYRFIVTRSNVQMYFFCLDFLFASKCTRVQGLVEKKKK